MKTTEVIDAMNNLTVEDLKQLPASYTCFLSGDVLRWTSLVESFQKEEREVLVRNNFQRLMNGEDVILMLEFRPLVEAGVLETFTEYSGPRCQDETEMVRLRREEAK